MRNTLPFQHFKIRASRRDPATGASWNLTKISCVVDETRVHSTSIFVLIRLCHGLKFAFAPDSRRCDRKVRGNTPSHLRVLRILWSDARVSLGAGFAAPAQAGFGRYQVLGPGRAWPEGSIGLPRRPRRSDTDSCGTAAYAEPLAALARQDLSGALVFDFKLPVNWRTR